MRLYHFTASCNLERIVNEGRIWAVNAETNNHMSLGFPVVWLTERPDDCIATDSDIKQLREREYEDLATKIEGRARQMFAGCPDDPGHICARITLKITNSRKRHVIRCYEWLEGIGGADQARAIRAAQPNTRPDQWWICEVDVPVTWIDCIEPVGEPSAYYIEVGRLLEGVA
jgi:hypothetical protein